jgi:CSLREA domain-containing protein
MKWLLGWKSGSGRPTLALALAGTGVVALLAIVVTTAVGAGHRVVARPAAAVAAGPAGLPLASDTLGSPLAPRLLTGSERWPAFGVTVNQPTSSAEPRLTATYRSTSVRLHGSRWSGSLSLGEVGRGDRLVPVSGGLGRRADGAHYSGAGVEESFAAVPTGIEQSFTVSRRISGSGPLVVEVGLAGLRASGSDGALLLQSAGRAVAVYSALRVADAAGHVIRARMRPSVSGRAIVIYVADEHARYPLRIDPILGTLEPGPTFTVDTTQDTNDGACDVGACSLRDAITAADAYTPDGSGPTTINFNIPGSGVQTIQPVTPLPVVTAAMTIDATTQSGYAGSPVVVLDGSAPGPGTLTGGGGGIGGSVQSASSSCPAGSVVTGLQASQDSRNYVGQVAVICTAPGGAVTDGSTIGDAPWTNSTLTCSGTDVGLGIYGAAGDIDDAIGIRCGPVGGTPTDGPLITDNSGAAQGPFDCPGGSALSGLTGTYGNYYGEDVVVSLTPVCTTAAGDGLDIDASQTTVRGLAIVGFAGNGIAISGGGDNVITQDWIGWNPVGGGFDGNGQNGIAIVGSAGDQIGGSGPQGSVVVAGNGDGNAGNDGADILISGSASSGNVVQGSWIGLGADGTSPANDRNGVLIDDGATGNTIGGSSTAGNVIYGLYAEGVYVTLAGSGNVIAGNTIGANANGSLGSFASANIGITVENSPGTTIGDDAAPGAQANTANGNVIVGQTGDAGLFINSPGTTVAGNFIGTNSVGATGLGDAYGIYIASGSANVIGPGNTVADNSSDGLSVSNDGTQITGNSITGNAAGIVTNGDATTPALAVSSPDTGSTTALNATVNAAAGAQVAVEFFATSTCDSSGSGEGGTFLGSSTTTVGADGSGTVSVASALPTSGEAITATATTTLAGESSPSTSAFSNCSNVASEADNTTWPNAQPVSLDGNGAGNTTQSIDLSGEARWYKVPISPGGSVQLNLTNLPADYNLALFSDISQAQASLAATSTSDLQTLSTELPGSSFSPSEFSPSEFSPSEFSPSEFSPSEFSPSEFSPSEFSPSEFSPSEFSPSEFSPSEFSPSVISPSEFSPSEFSPSEFSPSEFSPSTTVTDEQNYEDAQIQSLLAVSDNGGGADQTISADTWNNTGYFYIRVTGANGAYDPGAKFSLGVQVNSGTCAGVSPSSAPLFSSSFNVPGSSYKTLILTDESRMTDDGELSQMENDLPTFAGLPSVDGTIVDVGADSPQVSALQTQADANPDCPYAENLVADSIRNVVLAARAANPGLKYVVVIGDDHVIPFFRYPDTAGIGSESGYVPPVLNTSPSFASLESDDFLSEDAYGASTLLNEDGVQVPVPDLPVGRLVETPTEIDGMLQAYMSLSGGVVATPSSSLVTGYDFMTAGANAVESDLSSGLGSSATNDTLITNDGVAPSDTGAPPDHSWTASQLETALLSKRHDLIYLGAHFSANNTLAADYSTTMNAQQLASSNVNLENSIVLSAGCHAGYNIVGGDAVPGVTQTLDWVGAFAQKQATLIAGTGYQYGDTDFLAYSDQLYADFSHALRYGSGPVAVGSALVDAKNTYLDNNPNVQGIDIKSLLEATLYGLPMLSVNLPAGRIPEPTSSPVVSSPASESSGPGSGLRLSSTDITLSPTLTTHTTQLEGLNGGSAPTSTYLSGPNGVESSPAEPTLPLADSDVSVPGQVLRGVGFTGGTYTDQSGITPLTGAPATELSGVHSTFSSSSFFPSDLWTVNYFGALTGGSAGTQLMLTPAQYESDAPGSLTDTQRSYSNVGLRLFYSDDTSASGANTPALAAPPTISQVSATASGGTVSFQAHVVGDPSAGIQQVWVTYSGVTTPASGTGEWQSLDLTQDATDSTLWTGTLTGLTQSQIADLKFMVQAANGVGLVSLDDNDGSYYVPGQITGGLQSQALQSSSLTLNSPPSSGGYGSSVPVSATLTSDGTPVSGALVDFTIGSASVQAQTDTNGVAQTQVRLTGAPGSNYQLTASYEGSTTQSGTSVTAPFTVNQVATTLTLGGPTSAAVGASTGITASLQSGALGQPGYSVAFVLTPTGGGSPVVQTAITALDGVATLGGVPELTPGAYSVQAFFGPGAPIALPADPILLPSQTGSSPFNVTGQPPAMQSNNATTFTIGTNGLFTVSSTGTPTNTITNANFSSCTRSSALPAGVTLTDNGNNTATLAGTPAAGTAGTYTLCLNASNGYGTAATQQFTLTVARATPTTPTISNLPASGTYGASFTANVATNGDGATSVTSSTPAVCTVSSTSKVSFVGVGPCTLTAQLAQGASYAAAHGNAQTVSVATAPLQITASSGTMIYGASVPAITPSYLGFVNGDTTASLKTLPSCRTTATSGSAPASYPTSCSGAADANYTITYVPGSLTVAQTSTTLTYTGPQTASTKSTFVPAATLSNGPSGCDSGQPVAFTLNVNPITGAAGPYTLESATTSSAGVGTGAAISTAQWQYGSYTLTATYAGSSDCAGSVTSVALSVTEPGLAASGVGIYTAPGAGGVSFGFAAGLKPRTQSTYLGALALVDNSRWELIASVTAYAKSNSTTAALSGKGNLYWWNPVLDRSRGGWALAASNVAYTARCTTTTRSSPGSFGITITYTPAPGQPSPLPNSAPITLTKGAITLS